MSYDQFGAVVTPIYETTTFAASDPEELELRFEVLTGKKPKPDGPFNPYVYARFGTPTSDSACRKLVEIEQGARFASLFPSGMGAIYSTVMALVKPGDVVLYTTPIYGCTDDFFRNILKTIGVTCIAVDTTDLAQVEEAILANQMNLRAILLETPCNPKLGHSPIRAISDLAAKYPGTNSMALTIVDNTFLGPVFQSPFLHNADIVVYSATKFLGGHTNLLAGAVLAQDPHIMKQILSYQYTSGSVLSAFSCAKLEQSLETVDLRMEREAGSAIHLAKILSGHSRVRQVFHPSLLQADTSQYDIFHSQCSGTGSVISFEVDGGKQEAYRFIRGAKQGFTDAVSLGGTHSLGIVPYYTTHLVVPDEVKLAAGVTPGLIRLSVGTEPLERLSEAVVHGLKAM